MIQDLKIHRTPNLLPLESERENVHTRIRLLMCSVVAYERHFIMHARAWERPVQLVTHRKKEVIPVNT